MTFYLDEILAKGIAVESPQDMAFSLAEDLKRIARRRMKGADSPKGLKELKIFKSLFAYPK